MVLEILIKVEVRMTGSSDQCIMTSVLTRCITNWHVVVHILIHTCIIQVFYKMQFFCFQSFDNGSDKQRHQLTFKIKKINQTGTSFLICVHTCTKCSLELETVQFVLICTICTSLYKCTNIRTCHASLESYVIRICVDMLPPQVTNYPSAKLLPHNA